jgi:hypothetical protein
MRRVIIRNTERIDAPQPEPSSAFDATASEKKWRSRFSAQRTPIGQTTVVEDAGTLLKLLMQWPDYDHENDEKTDARKLKDTLGSTDTDFENKLLNLLEQAARQAIIREAIEAGLVGRKVLGIVAAGRLEAVCIWTTITGTASKDQESDANWWNQEWRRTLYIPELTSAPWNVGWPTKESGVSGAATTLVNAMKAKGRAEQCDGIGLVGFSFNLGFYLHVGFKIKTSNSMPPLTMDLRT